MSHKPDFKILGIGAAVGLLWIAMAAYCLWSSFQGYANDRRDWGLGWGLIGVLLLGGGAAALVGTWWHQFRVKPGPHHHH